MAKDKFYSNVSLLLLGNGSDNSTTIVDNSPNTKTITPFGAAKISHAVNDPCGHANGVLYFDGNSSGIKFPTSDEFDFGSGDFTLEFFVYLLATNSNTSRIYNPDGDFVNGVGVDIGPNGNVYVYLASQSAGFDLLSGPSVAFANNTWVHCALVRHINDVGIYINGVYSHLTTLNYGAIFFFSSHPYLSIGGQEGSTNRSLNGYLSNYRITKSKARYTSNFTVPNSAFSIASYAIECTLNNFITANQFLLTVNDLATGTLLNAQTVTVGLNTVDPKQSDPVFITALPIQGTQWKANTVYAVNALVFPVNPSATPYYFKRLSAGTSGATEPTWTTSAGTQCNDGSVTNAWQCIAQLTQAITQGPLIPS